MFLPNAAHQTGLHRSYRADGTLTNSSAQLVLPVALSRAMLMVMNCSNSPMYMDHGPARATSTITSGTVTGTTITNAGFNYTYPPIVEFVGGHGNFLASSTWNGLGLIGSNSPQGLNVQGLSVRPTHARIAKGRAVLSGGAVASITIDDLGSGYINPPEILLTNDPRDPFGCAVPVSGTSIVLNASGGFYYINGSACHTDQIALIGTTSSAFVVEYML